MSELLKCHDTGKGNIVTPQGRLWFVAVAEKFVSPEDKVKGREGAYTVSLVVPPTADLSLLKAAIEAKAKEKWGEKVPGNLKRPIRSCKDIFTKKGEAKYPEEYANHLQITANTYTQQPGVIMGDGSPVSKLQPGESTDDVKARIKELCYQGRWARISVSPAAYSNESNGVKLYLQNIQLLKDDEAVGGYGGSSAEEDFTPVGEAAAESIFG